MNKKQKVFFAFCIENLQYKRTNKKSPATNEALLKTYYLQLKTNLLLSIYLFA